MKKPLLLLALGVLYGACTNTAAPVVTAPLPATPEAPASVVPVENPNLPPGHPSVPLGDPSSNLQRVGRAARRMNVDQLREALETATGFSWVARRTISDPDSPTGASTVDDADMLEALAATLGRPDYVTTTHESIDPAVTFSKLAGDAARSACKRSVTADVMQTDPAMRKILRHVEANTTDAATVRRNLSYLALRFWGRIVPAESEQLAPLVKVFESTSSVPAGRDMSGTMRAASTPVDGWRAVCIAMATSPQFLTY